MQISGSGEQLLYEAAADFKIIISGKLLAACVLSMLSFISSAQSPFDCANGLGYVIGNRSVSGANISDFYSYDLSSGTATIIKQNIIDPALGGSRFVNAIGFNFIDNYIWGFGYLRLVHLPKW